MYIYKSKFHTGELMKTSFANYILNKIYKQTFRKTLTKLPVLSSTKLLIKI